MTVYSFGDSFTAGLGTDSVYEESLLGNHSSWEKMSATEKNIQRRKVHKFRTENSFTHFFSKKLKLKYKNLGDIGCNNNYILDLLCSYIIGGEITEKDLVLVNFTSSLRNYPEFLPHFFTARPIQGLEGLSFGNREYSEEWTVFSKDGLLNKHLLKKYNGRATPFYNFTAEYLKDEYIKNSFDFKYIDFYNLNVVLYLQKLLDFYNINYIMFDAFDSMLVDKDLRGYKSIKKENYWGISETSIWSYLDSFNDKSLLEVDLEPNNYRKLHPSKKGHQVFAEELYKFYNKRYGKVLI